LRLKGKKMVVIVVRGEPESEEAGEEEEVGEEVEEEEG